LAKYALFKANDFSPSNQLSVSHTSLRLLLLQPPSKRSESQNDSIFVMKKSYRNYMQANRSESDVASLLVHEWMYLGSMPTFTPLRRYNSDVSATGAPTNFSTNVPVSSWATNMESQSPSTRRRSATDAPTNFSTINAPSSSWASNIETEAEAPSFTPLRKNSDVSATQTSSNNFSTDAPVSSWASNIEIDAPTFTPLRRYNSDIAATHSTQTKFPSNARARPRAPSMSVSHTNYASPPLPSPPASLSSTSPETALIA